MAISKLVSSPAASLSHVGCIISRRILSGLLVLHIYHCADTQNGCRFISNSPCALSSDVFQHLSHRRVCIHDTQLLCFHLCVVTHKGKKAANTINKSTHCFSFNMVNRMIETIILHFTSYWHTNKLPIHDISHKIKGISSMLRFTRAFHQSSGHSAAHAFIQFIIRLLLLSFEIGTREHVAWKQANLSAYSNCSGCVNSAAAGGFFV